MSGTRLKYNRPQFSKPDLEITDSGLSWRFTFGLYKGHPIQRPPISYLAWLRRTTPNLDIARRCTEEIERRRRVKIN